jgi:hypothetical protein
VRVKLDRDTGVVRVLEVSCSHDSGTIINETGAEGQVEGGVMMGMGQALSEGTKYDDEGRQLNAALLEYKLQTMPDAPPITVKWVQTNATDGGPRGSKGVAGAQVARRRDANALAKLPRCRAVAGRSACGSTCRRWARELHRSTRSTRRSRPWPRARILSPAARPRGRRAPASSSACGPGGHPRRRGSRLDLVEGGDLVLGALVNHAELEANLRSRPAGPAWRTAARSSARPRHAMSEPSAATS